MTRQQQATNCSSSSQSASSPAWHTHWCSPLVARKHTCVLQQSAHRPRGQLSRSWATHSRQVRTRSNDWHWFVPSQTPCMLADVHKPLPPSSGSPDPHMRRFVASETTPQVKVAFLSNSPTPSGLASICSSLKLTPNPRSNVVSHQSLRHDSSRRSTVLHPVQPEPLPCRSRFHCGISSHQTPTRSSLQEDALRHNRTWLDDAELLMIDVFSLLRVRASSTSVITFMSDADCEWCKRTEGKQHSQRSSVVVPA